MREMLMQLNVIKMRYFLICSFTLCAISCLKFNRPSKQQLTVYDDSLIYLTKNDSINVKIFKNQYIGNCELRDANEIKTEFRTVEKTLYNKLVTDTINNKTTLVKKFDEFYRQVTYIKCKDTQWISVFYLLPLRKPFKIPHGFFDRIVTGVFAPINCDIFQYQVTYNIKTGNYNMYRYHCD